MSNSPGTQSMYAADYDSITEWSPKFKAAVAESIAFNALRESIKENPLIWVSTDMEFKTAEPTTRNIYDRYYDDLDEDKSRWRPDGFFYSKQRAGDYPAHIVLQEVKTGDTIPDIRNSQFERMKEYAHRRRASVYYSFVEFTEEGFNLSMLQLVPDGPNRVKWFTHGPPAGTSNKLATEIKRRKENERELWADYAASIESDSNH